MRDFGLLGKSLSHSFSKSYFEQKFENEGITDARYSLFELKTIDEFSFFLDNHPDLVGFNVTIPYKRQIIPYLDELSDEVLKIRAVNTVKIIYQAGKRKTIGFNTDYIAFLQTIENNNFRSALILGSGGAAAAVKFALSQKKCACQTVSRTNHDCLKYDDLNKDIIQSSDLIVNCTPLGTYPNVNELPPIPYQFVEKHHFLYDLVYNPCETAFLREGKKRRATTQNGLQMLHIQADFSWRIWNTYTKM